MKKTTTKQTLTRDKKIYQFSPTDNDPMLKDVCRPKRP